MFDVKLALADLTNRPGKEAETRKTLEDLAREDPKRPEPWAGLGYLAWRGNQIAEAVEAFGKAYELGDRSPRLLWDYGRLAEREHPEDRAQRAHGSLQTGARAPGRSHGTRRFAFERPASRRGACDSGGCAQRHAGRCASFLHAARQRADPAWRSRRRLASPWRNLPRTRRRPRIGLASTRCSAIWTRPTPRRP